jgi:hypothetical protein
MSDIHVLVVGDVLPDVEVHEAAGRQKAVHEDGLRRGVTLQLVIDLIQFDEKNDSF